MSVQRHTPTERENAWSNVDECLRDIDHLTHGLPLSDMIDYARENGLGQAVIDGLEKLEAAACVLINEGPDVAADFARAVGMTDDLVARERDRHRAARDDPKGLFQTMRRMEQGK